MPDPSGAPLPWEMNYGAPQGPQPADPYYTRQMPKPQPFPGALPPLHGPDTSSSDRTRQLIQQGNTLLPTQVAKAKVDLDKANLELRKERMAQGLDPDTGKAPEAGAVNYGPDALKDLSPEDAEVVKKVVQGRIPITSFSMKSPYWTNIVKKAAMYDPGFDMTAYPRRMAAFKQFMAGTSGQNIDRINTALQHLNSYREAAMGLDNFHEGAIGQVGNYGRAAYLAAAKDSKYTRFAAARDAVAGELAAAFKGSNDTALASIEHWQSVLSAANSPEAVNAATKEVVQLLSGRIDAVTSRFQQAVGSQAANSFDLMSPKARNAFDKYSSPTFGTDAEKDDKRLDPNTKGIELPAGYQSEHAEFLVQHPPGKLTAGGYLTERHALDDKYFTGGIKSLSLEDAQRFADEYNKHGMSPNTKIPTINIPTTKFEKKVIEGATSAPGVGMANAANAATLGLPELVAGEGGRSAMEHSNEEHPVAAALGEIAGSVAPIGGAENLALKGLEHIAPVTSRVKLAADALGNAAYQGERGFAHADDGEGGSGFLKGLAAGAGGSVVGNAVTKGVTPILSAATQDALKQLGGVDLTTFQRLGMGKAESSLASVPLAHGAQIKALVSFNRDNAGRTLNLLPEGIPGVSKKLPKGLSSGTEINDFVHKQLTNAYTTLKPQIAGSVDGTYANAIGALKVQAKSKPAKAAFKEIEDALGNFSSGGAYTGDGYVAASERLRSIVRDYAEIAENGGRESLTPSAARDISRLAEQARKQMQVLVARNQPELGMQLKGVERAYAKKMIAEDATNRALSNEGIYSPDQALTSMKKLDTSANSARSARGQAFDQSYLGAASKVMGSTVPKKISPKETSIVLVSLGLGSAAAPVVGKIAAAAMVGAYGPVVKRVFQKVLSGQRPSTVDNALMRRIVSAEWGSQFQGHLPELPEGSK